MPFGAGSQVPGDCLEFIDTLLLVGLQWAHRVVQTMFYVILDQYSLGLLDGLLYSVKLLGDVQAGTPILNHLGHALQVPSSSAQALDDIRMRLVGMCCHIQFLVGIPIPLGRMLCSDPLSYQCPTGSRLDSP